MDRFENHLLLDFSFTQYILCTQKRNPGKDNTLSGYFTQESNPGKDSILSGYFTQETYPGKDNTLSGYFIHWTK